MKITHLLLTCLVPLALAACGGEGKLGDSCDTVGGTTDVCEAGTICSNEAGGENRCRKVCVDQTQCADTENCNGISGSQIKSCQPK